MHLYLTRIHLYIIHIIIFVNIIKQKIKLSTFLDKNEGYKKRISNIFNLIIKGKITLKYVIYTCIIRHLNVYQLPAAGINMLKNNFPV